MRTFEVLCVAALIGASNMALAGRILLTEFDFAINSGVNVYQQMETNLELMGHTVDRVNAKAGGNVASALAANVYDQVFLWDLTDSRGLNTADIDALSSFWRSNSGLVVDTRSYGFHFQGSNPSEIALIQNVARNLDLSGGGVWVGTDHNPNWTRNANPFLAAIGVTEIGGSFSNPVNFADPSSVLLSGVTPTDLWAAGQSVGRAPLGLQANGIDMFLHFGSVTGATVLPYISASFDLRGVDPDPVPANAPATLGILALSLLVLARKKRV